MYLRNLFWMIWCFLRSLGFSILIALNGQALSLYAADLVLSGKDTLVIDTPYALTGNIFVKDNARLTIRNTTLTVNMAYHEQFDIWVSGNATLEVIGSTVKSSLSGNIVRIFMLGTSNLVFQDANLTDGSAYFAFGIEGNDDPSNPDTAFFGQATLARSKIHNISLNFLNNGGATVTAEDSVCNTLSLRFNGNYQGEFSDLNPGLFPIWTYLQGNYYIRFQNTRFNNFLTAADGPSSVVIRNSTISQFAPTRPAAAISMTAIDSRIWQIPLHGLTSIKAAFQGLRPGRYDDWRLQDNAVVTSGELANIVLRNTDVQGWGISVFGNSNITVDDSAFEFRVYGNGSQTIVRNSNVLYRFMLYGATNSTVEFVNTSMENLELLVPPNSVAIRGSLKIPTSAKVTVWTIPSVIRRTYPVQVQGQEGVPFPVMDLALYDNNSNLVWSGKTDASGKGTFDIEFNDGNHTSQWNLMIHAEGKTVNRVIGILTSTPITFDRALNGPIHPADTGQNSRIEIGECTAYGHAWKTGAVWPVGPNPVPIGHMTNACYLWKMGEVYRYDANAPQDTPPYVLGGASNGS